MEDVEDVKDEDGEGDELGCGYGLASVILVESKFFVVFKTSPSVGEMKMESSCNIVTK